MTIIRAIDFLFPFLFLKGFFKCGCKQIVCVLFLFLLTEIFLYVPFGRPLLIALHPLPKGLFPFTITTGTDIGSFFPLATDRLTARVIKVYGSSDSARWSLS